MATDDTQVALLRHIADLKESYPLQDFNPLKAGGVADFFAIAHDTIELAAAVKAAIDCQVPYLVIGQGSSILFSDSGFPGLVIQNKTHALAIDKEKSQVVVDSGVPLRRLITAVANQDLGGLTHLYGELGTVGGAVYGNVGPVNMPISSSLRYVTVLVPPAKIDKEATIVRYKGQWLQKEGYSSKLYYQKSIRSYQEYQPIILTLLLQLTSVRTDEVRLRLQRQATIHAQEIPMGNLMGPIFFPHATHSVDSMLLEAGLARIKVGDITVERRHPNFLSVRGGAARSQDIRTCIELMQEKVEAATGEVLRCRYEYLGVW